jgi:DNA-binding CsgD family transcriptional regulator
MPDNTCIENMSNLNKDDIDNLMIDSINNECHYKKFSAILMLDHIRTFFHFKIFNDNQFQFQTNMNKENLTKCLKANNTLFHPKLFSRGHSYFFRTIPWNIDHKSSEKETDNLNPKPLCQYALIFERLYSNRKEAFFFITDRENFDNLNFQAKSLLAERLNSIICLIQLSTSLEQSIYFNIPKNWNIKLNNQSHQYKKMAIQEFGLSEITISYIKELAAGSHINEIAVRLHKSPRTVENTMYRLCDKFGLDNNDELKIYARAINTYLTGEC